MPDPITAPHADAPLGGALGQVPVEIRVSVGHARPAIKDLLRLTRDSVLALDRRVEDPVELFVGDRLIARGFLEEHEADGSARLAVRVTEVADLSNGL